MAMAITYDNIAQQAWWLIQTINRNNPSTPLKQYLGPAGDAIIAPHFPNNWLSGIRIHSSNPVPAINMDDFSRIMGYANTSAFETACSANPVLWGVLKQFSDGTNFNGITYNDTIYLKTSEKYKLDLILHELVHTLQWSYFKPIQFLQKYISGFVTHYPNYQQNPAEVRAYYFENQFKSRTRSLGPFAGGGLSLSTWGTQIAQKPVMQRALGQLTAMASLNINIATATQGM
jgi:hypothetical protein